MKQYQQEIKHLQDIIEAGAHSDETPTHMPANRNDGKKQYLTVSF